MLAVLWGPLGPADPSLALTLDLALRASNSLRLTSSSQVWDLFEVFFCSISLPIAGESSLLLGAYLVPFGSPW